MAKSGISHVVSAVPVPRSAYESEEHHALVSGTSFPASPVEKQLFYRTDLHKLYIYNGTGWIDASYGSADVSAAIDTHSALATGVHGVGASTIASVANISTHNADRVSSATHNNSFKARLYTAETLATIPNTTIGALRVPLDSYVYDYATGRNFGDWYGAEGAYRQADADSDATHIQDDDAAFTNNLLYATVYWASNAAGTLNTGKGLITAVNAATLTIAKFEGVNFAASYYFRIKHAEYIVSVSGLYVFSTQIVFSPAETDQRYMVQIYIIDGNSTPALIISCETNSSQAAVLGARFTDTYSLTIGQRIILVAGVLGTSYVSSVYPGSQYTFFNISLDR